MMATKIIIITRILMALSKKMTKQIKEKLQKQMNEQMIFLIKAIITTMTMKTSRTKMPIT